MGEAALMYLQTTHSPQALHYLLSGILNTLNELSESAHQQPLRKIERIAIGMAKQYCKQAG
jgi:hypothetical protein